MKSGFTLVEMLIVTALIGVFATLGSGAFIASQKQGRDGRRVADLKTIQSALETYYTDTGAYPNETCSSLGTAYFTQGFPKDPRTNTAYQARTCTTQSYCFCVTMEGGRSGNASANDCSNFTPGDYFCVRNVQ